MFCTILVTQGIFLNWIKMWIKMPKMNKSFYITLVVIAAFVICCFGQEMSLSRDIGDAAKSAIKTFVVKCEGRCKDITATVKVDSGDPDLFASEEQPPQIGWKKL